MTLTKQDIDALVDGMDINDGSGDGPDICIEWEGCTSWIPVKDMRRALYLAAGLTAEGQRKPERVKCYLYRNAGQDDPRGITIGNPPQGSLKSNGWEVIPGWFVPDGAE